jgi:hypothetical protein
VKIAYFQIWLKEFWIGSSESSLSGRALLVSGVAGIFTFPNGGAFQFVLTGFDDGGQYTIVIQDSTFPGLRRTHSDSLHVGHDSGDGFSKIGNHNLLPAMNDWTNDATRLAMQLGDATGIEWHAY